MRSPLFFETCCGLCDWTYRIESPATPYDLQWPEMWQAIGRNVLLKLTEHATEEHEARMEDMRKKAV